MKPSFPVMEKNKPSSKIPSMSDSGIEIKPTICSICNVSTHCGIDAHVKDGVVIKVEGSKTHPSSVGKLCVKGAAGLEYIYSPDRLTAPLLRQGERGSGDYKTISWNEALDRIADKLNGIKNSSGPESVVFGVGYTKWLRPFLKRLARSFGSPNYITESSTCHTAMAMAFRLNYGETARADIGNTQCLLVWGCNPFYSKNPGAIRGLLRARRRGMKIIDVGPLVTPLSRIADLHLRIRPGTSGALALGLAHVIVNEDIYDSGFVEKWTHGFDDYRTLIRDYTPEHTQKITGVPSDLIKKAARMYAQTKPAALMTSASTTVHHTNGVQNTRAIAALPGLTGNWDIKGGNVVDDETYLYIPAGLTTREAEFIAPRNNDEMAAPIGSHTFPVWNELVDEAQGMRFPFRMDSQEPYPIRAMLSFGLNHRLWPGSDFMREALKKLEFLVDVDLFMTDTARLADIILPACSSFERSELKFHVQRYVIWTQPVISPLGQSRSDADIICEIAKRLVPEDTLLGQGHEACIDWILEPSGLSLNELKKHPAGFYLENTKDLRYEKYKTSGFGTPTNKMEFSSTILKKHDLSALPVYQEPKYSPVDTNLADKYPLMLTTGARKPLFIHSRTFRMPTIRRLRPYPTVDINPVDASRREISQGEWVTLHTSRSEIRVKANLTETTPPRVVNLYHHFPGIEVNELFDPDYLDPISGFAGFKSSLCQVERSPDQSDPDPDN